MALVLRIALIVLLVAAMFPWGAGMPRMAAKDLPAAGLPTDMVAQSDPKTVRAYPAPRRCRLPGLTANGCGPDILPISVAVRLVPPPGAAPWRRHPAWRADGCAPDPPRAPPRFV